MLSRVCCSALLATCLLLIAAKSTLADPITLTSGTAYGGANFIDNPYSLNVAGTGFSLQQNAEGYFLPGSFGLQAGQIVSLSGQFVVSMNFGVLATVTYNGVNYTNLIPSGTLTLLHQTFTVPSPLDANSTVTTPFSLVGTLAFADINNVPLFSVDLVGSGLVTFTFNGSPGPPGRYSIGDARYTFAPPIPEPTTVLLLSSGLLGVVTTIQRRRSRQSGRR
jgi:hypothetical protein